MEIYNRPLSGKDIISIEWIPEKVVARWISIRTIRKKFLGLIPYTSVQLGHWESPDGRYLSDNDETAFMAAVGWLVSGKVL